MNKFKLYFYVFATLTVLFSCNKADSPEIIPPRDFQEQYISDSLVIHKYLEDYCIDSSDVNQVFKLRKIIPGSSDIALLNSSRLCSIKPTYDGVEYTVYYIKIKQGSASGIKPVKVDQVLTAYKGSYLNFESTDEIQYVKSTDFEYIPFPENFIFLNHKF